MLAKRIIPCLDVRGGKVVKGQKFQNVVDVADPVLLAKRYSDEGADELVFYDITASYEERDIFTNVIANVAKEINIPFTVGGGISKEEDFRRVLLSGADKVSVNTAAVKDPSLISKGARRFGSQCVVLSIDAKKKGNSYTVYTKGGREDTGIDVIWWAKKGEELGAGEICINSIDCDGEKHGFDTQLLSLLNSALNIPIIASGGAGTMEDFTAAFRSGADAALAASIFHFDEIKIKDLKDYLYSNNIPVRRLSE